MAVTPTFIASMALLKQQLRLSGAAGTDALAVIDSAVVKARKKLAAALGIALVTSLQGMAYDENAITETALKRARANDLELSLVRLYCLRTMPVLFMQNSGGTKEIWNNEAATRAADQSFLKQEIARLEAEIAEDVAVLTEGEIAEVGGVQGGCIEPDALVNPAISVSRSIQGGYRQLAGYDSIVYEEDMTE